jgi:hypothetical protein
VRTGGNRAFSGKGGISRIIRNDLRNERYVGLCGVRRRGRKMKGTKGTESVSCTNKRGHSGLHSCLLYKGGWADGSRQIVRRVYWE